ncbi:MAG: RNA-binding S4 domain-containing protein [Acidobacteria bacterium]|nr:RNA-binding S4 domain-containing protein [Acidobacteriota bacterium]
MRIDKWLWAARFFKTRALSARACDFGRVSLHESPVKPAKELRTGDRLRIRNDSGDFVVDVLLLLEQRGPASVAQTMYRETAESLSLRQKAAEERKALPWFDHAAGRPSKKDRRDLERFRSEM